MLKTLLCELYQSKQNKNKKPPKEIMNINFIFKIKFSLTFRNSRWNKINNIIISLFIIFLYKVLLLFAHHILVLFQIPNRGHWSLWFWLLFHFQNLEFFRKWFFRLFRKLRPPTYLRLENRRGCWWFGQDCVVKLITSRNIRDDILIVLNYRQSYRLYVLNYLRERFYFLI